MFSIAHLSHFCSTAPQQPQRLSSGLILFCQPLPCTGQPCSDYSDPLVLSQVPQGSDHFPQPATVFFLVQPMLPSAPGHTADPCSSYCPPGPLSFTSDPQLYHFSEVRADSQAVMGHGVIPGAGYCISPK